MSRLRFFKSATILYYILCTVGLGFLLTKSPNIHVSILFGFVMIVLFLISIFTQYMLFEGLIIPFTSYFNFTENTKEILHKNYKNLIIEVTTDCIIVWHQSYLYRSHIVSIENTGYMEDIVKKMDSSLSDMYNKRITTEKWHSDRISILDEWDGFLDVKSKRDDKLSKIL